MSRDSAGIAPLSAAEEAARIEEMGGMAVMQRPSVTEPSGMHRSSIEQSSSTSSAHTSSAGTGSAEGSAAEGGFGAPLWADIRRKVPHVGSDVRDGLHPAAAASTMFLFFACLTPCIAFGGLTAAQTGGAIGVVETILGTAISGVVYAMFSGQPLTLLGPTGLVVVFTGLLYKSAAALALPFLPVYAWVSVWSAAFLLVLSLTGASDLIRLFTRFTDETFSLLISLGFIAEPCKVGDNAGGSEEERHGGSEGVREREGVFIMLLSAAAGLPWMVASTVPSLSHVRSLSFTQPAAAAAASSPSSPAAASAVPQQRVRENRVTGVAIHVCIGASLLLLPLLSRIPVSVTEGLFLYMGVSSLAGNQLVDRLKLLLTDPSRFPDYPYIRGVARSSVYGFTALQGACLVALWQLKHSKLGEEICSVWCTVWCTVWCALLCDITCSVLWFVGVG
ncbi:unnamed protein product [Closterium sp. NIES-54]